MPLSFWFFALPARRWGLARLLAVVLLLAPGPTCATRTAHSGWAGQAGCGPLRPLQLGQVALAAATATRAAGVMALGQHAGRLWVGYDTDPLTVAQLSLRDGERPSPGSCCVLPAAWCKASPPIRRGIGIF